MARLARLVGRAEEWERSSVRAHVAGRDDGLVTVAPLAERLGDFAAFLGGAEDQQATRALRRAESTGRPVGSVAWLQGLERSTGRALRPRKPGRKPLAPHHQGAN